MKLAFNTTLNNSELKFTLYAYIYEMQQWIYCINNKYFNTVDINEFKNYINRLVTKYYWCKDIVKSNIITVTTDTIINELKANGDSEMLTKIFKDIITEPKFYNMVKLRQIVVDDELIDVYSFEGTI